MINRSFRILVQKYMNSPHRLFKKFQLRPNLLTRIARPPRNPSPHMNELTNMHLWFKQPRAVHNVLDACISITRASGRGWALEFESFWALWNVIEPIGECHLGPKMHPQQITDTIRFMSNVSGPIRTVAIMPLGIRQYFKKCLVDLAAICVQQQLSQCDLIKIFTIRQADLQNADRNIGIYKGMCE